MVDLDAIKVVLQRLDKGLECSDTLVATARDQLKLVEEKFTSHNTGSPKLPTLVEVCAELQRRSDHITTYGMYALGVNECYDVMCRQLRAGA